MLYTPMWKALEDLWHKKYAILPLIIFFSIYWCRYSNFALVYGFYADIFYSGSIHAIPFCNQLPAEMVNVSPVKSITIILDANWLSQFLHMISFRNSHPHEPFHMPPRLVVYGNPHCSLDFQD